MRRPMAWSAPATRAQLRIDFHAGGPEGCAKARTAAAAESRAIIEVSVAETSAAKMSRKLSGLIY